MKIIYSLRLARYLIDHNFHCAGTMPNPKKPWFNAYLFYPSKELEAAISDYLKKEEKHDGK